MTLHFFVSTNNLEGSNFSVSSPALTIICLFYYSPPRGCKFVSHSGLICIWAYSLRRSPVCVWRKRKLPEKLFLRVRAEVATENGVEEQRQKGGDVWSSYQRGWGRALIRDTKRDAETAQWKLRGRKSIKVPYPPDLVRDFLLQERVLKQQQKKLI